MYIVYSIKYVGTELMSFLKFGTQLEVILINIAYICGWQSSSNLYT